MRNGSAEVLLLVHSMGGIGAALAALALPAERRAGSVLVLEDAALPPPGSGSLPVPPRLSPPVWRLRPLVKLLPILLRRAVYSRGFWARGLRLAGGAAAGEEEQLRLYRWPSLVEGWDVGLARFVATRAHGVPEEEGLAERLRSAINEWGLRVLVVHGEQDRLVPLSNSELLASFLGAELVVLPCGHIPHEQALEAFARAVADFLAGNAPPA